MERESFHKEEVVNLSEAAQESGKTGTEGCPVILGWLGCLPSQAWFMASQPAGRG